MLHSSAVKSGIAEPDSPLSAVEETASKNPSSGRAESFSVCLRTPSTETNQEPPNPSFKPCSLATEWYGAVDWQGASTGHDMPRQFLQIVWRGVRDTVNRAARLEPGRGTSLHTLAVLDELIPGITPPICPRPPLPDERQQVRDAGVGGTGGVDFAEHVQHLVPLTDSVCLRAPTHSHKHTHK